MYSIYFTDFHWDSNVSGTCCNIDEGADVDEEIDYNVELLVEMQGIVG